MIFRKIPLASHFPDFSTIKELSAKYITQNNHNPLFFDIETTGLSASSSYCYLIGCINFEDGHWILRQWLAEHESDEKIILTKFSDFACNFSYTIQYNGNKFDIPYLLKRCELHNIETSFAQLPAIDLFYELKSLKNLLRFHHMKQPDLEEFLGVEKRIFADGKLCIKCYKEYCKSKASEPLQEVLGHNTEDLHGLGQIFLMLTYRQLITGEYTIESSDWDGINYILYFKLLFPLPVSFSYSNNGIYITGNDNCIQLLVNSNNKKLKMYYSNYKDYSYLPFEDTAIPKSLSTYIDKTLRQPARPETCYTWFEVNEQFLNNNQQQMKYLQHLLDFILNHA